MTNTDTPHTCLDGDYHCAGCQEAFDATPAGIVRLAIEKLDDSDPLGDLLQHLSDEMSDEHAEEKEFPNHIPSARWQVCEWYGRGPDYDRWTSALAVARSLLGLPDPNKVEVSA